MKKLLLFTVVFGVFAAVCLLFSNPDPWLVNAAALLVIAGGLLLMRKRSAFSVPVISLCLYFLLVILSLLNGSDIQWLLSGVVAAIGAWDLTLFQRNFQGETHIDSANQMINQHLSKLILSLICGWGFSLLALSMTIKLSFLVILLLCIAGIYGFFHLFKSLKS